MSVTHVSILIPAYKAARHLEETLQSVLAQTYPNWELIVLEDGVFDHTAEIVARLRGQTLNPVHLIQNATNEGVSSARNQLIDAATGSYLAFLDADDLWPPKYLQRALERLEISKERWQVSGSYWIDTQGRPLNKAILPPDVPATGIPTELLKHSFILPSAVVAHRSVFESGLRFDTRYPIGEDLQLWIELIRHGFVPLLVDEPLIHYRKHPNSATSKTVRFNEEFSRVFESYLGDSIVDQALCRTSIQKMLGTVIRMCWRNEPKRAANAIKRLRDKNIFPARLLPYRLLSVVTAALLPVRPIQ